MSTLAQVRKQLRAISRPAKAATSASFFKTGKGQYGEGDVFIGVTVPEQRVIAGGAKDLPLKDIAALLGSKIHEERLLGCLLLTGRAKLADKAGDAIETKKLADFYWQHRAGINNWDLVDSSAEPVLGPYYLKRSRAPLFKMALSQRVWDRRYAVLTTFYFIRRGEFRDTLRLAELLMEDKHDLIHKACGWLLREVGKRELSVLREFLKSHAARMPRTMLRYAIEKLAPAERRKFMHQ